MWIFFVLQAGLELALFDHPGPYFFMHIDHPGYSNNNR